MYPLPEGLSAVSNMYMWQSIAGAFYAPCVDGDYDMAVIGHEYGHLDREPDDRQGHVRTGHHAGAMGESNGDLIAMEYLNENGFVPTGDENRYAVGTYATGNKVRAIRNYGMNFPSSARARARQAAPGRTRSTSATWATTSPARRSTRTGDLEQARTSPSGRR